MLLCLQQTGSRKLCMRTIQTTPLDQRLLGQEDYMPPDTAAHTRHQETHHFQNCAFQRTTGLHMLGDVSKELPEDGEFEGLGHGDSWFGATCSSGV